ncbi:2-C-methyl-D-erythritol 4-phosphate cytidylyltransferase [candidate division KSB1 bacterium]|nr:2-C-methyl-D-erythritol 4-phosphate cytidylyltransferase [candidate division KSB1 bacterium]
MNRTWQPCAALIVAGGSGRRMGLSTRKQFLSLCGRPILQRTLTAFDRHSAVAEIVLVLPKEEIAARGEEIRQMWGLTKPLRLVAGGAERQDSVRAGLAAITAGQEWVLVHDGVRPLVTSALIERVLESARITGAAIPAVPVRETIKSTVDGWVGETLRRERLVVVQTPQAFRIELLRTAYDRAFDTAEPATDDAALVERLGEPVAVVCGDERNIKITTLIDLKIARIWLQEEETHANRAGL